MDRLADFIRRSAGEEWVERWSDCGPWQLRWVELVTGRTTSLPPYHDRETMLAMVKAHGGLTALVGEICEVLGLYETLTPKRGDIGVVAHRCAVGGEAGAIFLGQKWVVRIRQQGRAINATCNVKMVRAWRVE
ncbi:DUF6950 family protein [uncultured Cohaesibacter sp.]|uniref:DUF6950 family protein n=1 Tax=uncultured Cohaesibacter sp. TaxID=1002546 RepID=UPI0029C76FC8|nr:hypothetical protein [uncultured Cohaesibacter sp.]